MLFFKFICEKCCPRLDIGRSAGCLGQVDETRQIHPFNSAKELEIEGKPHTYDRIVAEYKMEHYNPKIDPTIRSKFIEGETVPAIMPHYERNAIHDY